LLARSGSLTLLIGCLLAVSAPFRARAASTDVQNPALPGPAPAEELLHEAALALGRADYAKARTSAEQALASLKSAGTLAKIQQEWLSNKASAPVLK